MKIIFLVVLFSILSCTNKPNHYSEAKKSIREYLKQSLDDPGSYEAGKYIFDTTRKYAEGWRVEHYFRAKNKFGALVQDGLYFNLDSNFKVVGTEGLIEGARFAQ